nr:MULTISPECIES: alpha/beta hydrolase [unclassified Streptomyces]
MHRPVGVPSAAVVLFHGGGWRAGFPEQLVPQCRRLASAGVLAASAGYGLIGRDSTGIEGCAADARAAVEHVRRLAPGVPLFVGGGSAGGQLALREALDGGLRIAGLLLFNPVVDLCAAGPAGELLRETAGLDAARAEAVCPLHLVRPGAPPAIVFHGTADTIVLIGDARRFRDAMRASGNGCELVTYEGAPHGFFNPGAEKKSWHEEPMGLAVSFVRRVAEGE